MKISFFWFRRDLRIMDNTAFNHALKGAYPVLPVFIFDKNILDQLPKDDARVTFIYDGLQAIHQDLRARGSSVLCLYGKPQEVWEKLLSQYEIAEVYCNRDYEPYAKERDENIKSLLNKNNIKFLTFKDQVIFEKNEVVKENGKPYTVYTPYKNKWLEYFEKTPVENTPENDYSNLYQHYEKFPSLEEIGFKRSSIEVKDYGLANLDDYDSKRDYPAEDAGSYLGPHLRFGTVGIRQVISKLKLSDKTFLSELIWREFFMQILWHFPKVEKDNFHSKYDGLRWRNNENEFEKWCQGRTDYPLVDAGMRQINQTGYMHNRVRMVVASFLTKHLLIDWRWGEAFFAEKLLDYELSSNNGNWQWAAGTGCDAVPYFRIFNPTSQIQKFDRDLKYVKKWLPEYGQKKYPEPMVEHKTARERALKVYREAVKD